ncbi:MAG: ABC transporter ATP-binding protein [Oscillospiraceae bacterium]|nr:ABC transporter ATP-binding protein [Oscillospiraceae bacterium]
MLFEVKNLTKNYNTPAQKFCALNKVNFQAEEGEIIVILGPSGSGKSTFLNIIGGLDTGYEGDVIVGGTNLRTLGNAALCEYRRRNIGFVFQFYNLIPNLTVRENVEVCSDISDKPLNIDEVLAAVGISDKSRSFPKELSGGQQQRVSIARAVVKNPRILLCDEPTGALDYASAKDTLKLLEHVNRQYGTTILIITHNPAIADMADTVITLRSGEITSIRRNAEKKQAEEIEW